MYVIAISMMLQVFHRGGNLADACVKLLEDLQESFNSTETKENELITNKSTEVLFNFNKINKIILHYRKFGKL